MWGGGITAALQSLTKNEERVAASVVSPRDDKQEIHGGPSTDRVGQRHLSNGEHTEIALATLEHSNEQISTLGIS